MDGRIVSHSPDVNVLKNSADVSVRYSNAKEILGAGSIIETVGG